MKSGSHLWPAALVVAGFALAGCTSDGSIPDGTIPGPISDAGSSAPTDNGTWWSAPDAAVPELNIANVSRWYIDQDGNPIIMGTPPADASTELIISTPTPGAPGTTATAQSGYVGKTDSDTSGPALACGLLSSLGVSTGTTAPTYGCVSKFNDAAETDGTYYLYIDVLAAGTTQTQVFRINVSDGSDPQLVGRH